MAEQRRGTRPPMPAGGRPARAAPPTPAKVSPSPPSKAISPARLAAFELLQRVGTTSAHSDDLLHGPRLTGLSQVDRDLTTALVLGVLRWQIALDARIRPLLSRPETWPPEPVVIALRLGAFQLLHMDRIPAHAALNESVELARAAGQPQAAGMVNAVLRKLVGTQPARKPLVEPLAAMAERLAHPAWLVEGWMRQFGRGAAERICVFDQKEPGCEEIFAGGEGDAGFPAMDAGSRLVAELAAAACPTARRVWDCCAAPGGKLLVLAHRLPEAEILATDSSPKRLERLVARLARDLPARTIQTVIADAAELPPALGEFDLILCDVPCSGTGTLARNPEIRHRLRGEDLARQADRQVRLLGAALRRLAPGGCLLYSTCSLEKQECEEVVERALRNGLKDAAQETTPAAFQTSLGPVLESLRTQGLLREGDVAESAWVKGDHLRTLPGVNLQADGFFAALFARPA